MIGKTISHYKILSKLGEGGMGVVYKAEDLTLGRTVALKFLPPDSVAREEDRARLVHEARAAAALLHPNICPVHEIAEDEGRTFIAMAHIEGRSLKDRISEGPLPLDEALSIARQIGDALAAAHAKGIIHRDIKPANVMLTPDGRPMLMDFGLAKVSGATKLTRTGTTMGTVAYMSPEQVQGREADHRSDVWALGVVLYEMVSGRVPFKGEYEAALVYGIMNEDPAPLAPARSDIPAGFDGIVAKALDKDPERRYQSAEAFAADLTALAQDREALPAGRAVPARALGRLWRRWHLWQRAAAVASVVALAAIVSILVLRFWPSAPDSTKYSLAVMDFRDLATPDSLTVSVGLTELVSTGLTQADLIRVVSSERLHDLQRRLFGTPRGAIEDSQTLEIARKVEATLFLVATIGQTGASRFVNWRLVDAHNGENVGGGTAEGITLAGMADQIIAKAIPRIAHACGVKAASATTKVESITTESLRAYQHYIAGLLASEEFRSDDAIAEFEKAVAEDSTFALAYLELYNAYSYVLAPGAYRKREACMEEALRFESKLGIKDQMRLEAWHQRRAKNQIAALRAMHERWPDDRQTLRDLAMAMWRWWDFGESLTLFEEGLRLYPDDPVFGGPSYLYALVCMGRMEDALRATRLLVRKHPKDPNSWDELGQRYLALGLPDSAEAVFHRAVELDPRWNPENFSYCSYQRGDVKGAIAIVERILEQDDLGAHRRWGLIVLSPFNTCLASLYIEEGRYQKARDLIREYTVMPDMDMPEFRLLISMGGAQEVRELYDLWLKADSLHDYPRPLGRALAMLGDVKGAREAAQSLASRGMGMADYDALEIEAQAALADHDPRMALEFLAKLKKRGIPYGGYIDIDYRTALARAYRMQGRLKEAADVHRELLRIYGGHALSHYELGTIYGEMKRPADAKREYTKFLEMWSSADEDLPQLVDAKKRLAAL
jgi:tetratricopeptide (TPR) repeat protein/predicted Ser/Thr protein kinase